MRRRRDPEIIAGRVNADGSIAAGDGFTVQKGGTGGYTVSAASSMRLVSVTASSGANVNQTANVSFVGASSFGIIMYTANTAAAIDGTFAFIAVGVQQ